MIDRCNSVTIAGFLDVSLMLGISATTLLCSLSMEIEGKMNDRYLLYNRVGYRITAFQISK